jgi:hypothetical protein
MHSVLRPEHHRSVIHLILEHSGHLFVGAGAVKLRTIVKVYRIIVKLALNLSCKILIHFKLRMSNSRHILISNVLLLLMNDSRRYILPRHHV